jgi:hypothetical protein
MQPGFILAQGMPLVGPPILAAAAFKAALRNHRERPQ